MLYRCECPSGGTTSTTSSTLLGTRASMLLDRDAPGDPARTRELIAAGRAEAEQLGMARELVRFERLQARLSPA
jgi:hypothetical protein